MIILDTNTMYRIAGIENDEKLDINKLRNFIKENKCCCSIYTIFEILNSKEFNLQDKLKVFKYISSNKIVKEATDNINKQYALLQQKRLNSEEYYNQLLHIYGEEVIAQTYKNISFFIICYAYTTATIFIDNYERGISKEKQYFRKHFKTIQKEIDKHIFKIIKINLTSLLNENKYIASGIRNMLLLTIANLMTYYYELLKQAKQLFENKDKHAYYKLIKYFKNLAKELIKDKLNDEIEYDSSYLSVCKLILDEVKNGNEIFNGCKIEDIEEYLLSKIKDSIYFVDSNMKNDFEEYWLERTIKSLYIKTAKIKPNNFLDYEIIRALYYNDDYDNLITFDNDMQTILKNISSCKKFEQSINLIKTFYKNIQNKIKTDFND